MHIQAGVRYVWQGLVLVQTAPGSRSAHLFDVATTRLLNEAALGVLPRFTDICEMLQMLQTAAVIDFIQCGSARACLSRSSWHAPLVLS